MSSGVQSMQLVFFAHLFKHAASGSQGFCLAAKPRSTSLISHPKKGTKTFCNLTQALVQSQSSRRRKVFALRPAQNCIGKGLGAFVTSMLLSQQSAHATSGFREPRSRQGAPGGLGVQKSWMFAATRHLKAVGDWPSHGLPSGLRRKSQNS